MKIIKIFLLLTLFNAAMAGCSKKEEAKALPLTLSVSNISHSNEVSFILDEEEALTVDITSGNGGYTIIPKTMTFFQGNKLGEPVRTDVNPEEFVTKRKQKFMIVAAEQYIKKISFSGESRFDIITKLEEKLINKIAPLRIGIAINKNDLPSKIELLIKTLQEQIKNVIISFRPHPLMRNSFWKDLAKQYNCIFSDPSTENPFEFINNNDILIAGESSFHLDVALCKKRSFLCNLTNYNILDYYGYLKNGLISQLPENYSTLNDVSLKEESSERTKLIQFYVSNYKTSDWGKSAKFIANKLQKLI